MKNTIKVLTKITFFAFCAVLTFGCAPSSNEILEPIGEEEVPESLANVAERAQQVELVTPSVVTQDVTLVESPLTEERLGCLVADFPEISPGWHTLNPVMEDVSGIADINPTSAPWFINYIKGDDNGRVWIATDGQGLLLFDEAAWELHDTNTRDDMRGDAIRGLAVTNQYVYAGEYGSAGSGGVMIYDVANDSWENYWPGESNLTGGGVGGIGVAENGTAYLPAGAILNTVKEDNWGTISMPTGGGSNDGLVDKSQNYWLATGGGIFQLRQDKWESYFGLAAQTLATDSGGNIWAAGTDGLLMFNDQWQIFPRSQFPLGEFWMVAAAVDHLDRVWFVTQESVSVYNGMEWTVFTAESLGLEYGFDNAIGFDSFGCPWIAVEFGGMVVLNRQLSMAEGDFSSLSSGQ